MTEKKKYGIVIPQRQGSFPLKEGESISKVQVMQMLYKSTRNSQLRLEASQVIAQGISDEGGLFVPESFPDLSRELPDLAKLDYPALAKVIFGKFLTDFTEEEIAACVDKA